MLPTRNIAFDKQSKFIQDRITSVEKNFSELCSAFGMYARKVARLRDAGDEISTAVRQYAEAEDVNKTLSARLNELSTTLCAIEEYRNARAQRLEVKVVGELAQYENICKHFRGEVKHTLSVRESELARKRALDRVKERNPTNRQQIMHAETELRKASADMSRTAKDLHEQTDTFERKKLQNVKGALRTFVEIEMLFQAKALELYTTAYRQIDAIDCEADLAEYKERFDSEDATAVRRRNSAPTPSPSKKPQRSDSPSTAESEQTWTEADEDSDEEDEEEEEDEEDDNLQSAKRIK